MLAISIFSHSHNTSQQNSVQLHYATCRHDAHKNHHGNSVIGMFSRQYASFELQIQPTVHTKYIVIYYDFNPTSYRSGQAKLELSRHWQLWPDLKILKAEAAESQARTSLWMRFNGSRWMLADARMCYWCRYRHLKTIPMDVTDLLKFMNNCTGAIFISFAAYNNEHGEQTYAR